jgi:hypothetical protein
VSRTRTVWFIVPDGIDDPERVSGGNLYDRQLRLGLAARGWTMRMMPVADGAAASLALGAIAAEGIALVDGLVAGWAPAAIEAAAARVPVILIAHMVSAAFPGALAGVVVSESRAMNAASRVIATSDWTAGELVRLGLAARDQVTVAWPGSREVTRSHGADYRELLCVGAITPHKGQDVLVAALELLADKDWRCLLLGSQLVDAEFAARVTASVARFEGRIRMPGLLHGAALDHAYRRAGLLVAPSLTESFGMAVADARSLGIPILASAVGGIPESSRGGGVTLVAPGDPRALADALEEWLTDADARSRLRAQAELGSSAVPRWSETVDRVDKVLVAA